MQIETISPAELELLISRAQRNDKKAVDELMTHTYPLVKRIVYFLMESVEGPAKDVIQESVITASGSIKKFNRSLSRFETWIFRITRNKVVDHTRSVKRRLKYYEQYFLQRVSPFAPPEYAPYLTDHETRFIIEIIKMILPKDQVLCLLLNILEEFTHEEISEELKVPLGTVKSRIRRSKRELRPYLASLR